MLWLCLYFPQLPLEIFSRAQAAPGPWAVSQGNGSRRSVALCNAAAASLGIRPGMSLSAAGALAAALQVRERDEVAEDRALAGLAAWAGQFTSLVSLHHPQALLLEIAGSLKLFGGIDALLRRVRSAAAPLGYHTQTGVAPTPLAARLLARGGIAAPVTRSGALPAILQGMPLCALAPDLDEAVFRPLPRIGLQTAGDLLRLPRADLARRFGPALTDYLDRLLGRCPDPRPPFTPPVHFESHVPLPDETADAEALLFPARRLLLELSGFLAARQAAARCLNWLLWHEGRLPTRIAMALAAPVREPGRPLHLLRERLARTALEAPVCVVGLQAAEFQALPQQNMTLDGDRPEPGEGWMRLVERLRARLGDEAVRGLQCRPDHRPERAWQTCAPGAGGPALPGGPRPLWLLTRPVALTDRGGGPRLDGSPLSLLEGPERIESGWWDGDDAARDYFVAADTAHTRYWIFRERRGDRGWFLHGLFA